MHRRILAFTILELLVSCAVLAVLLVMLLTLTSTTSSLWKDTTGKMHAFADSRAALDQMTETLSQAVLNPYWDYDSVVNPTRYERSSELQFLSTPMSHLGPSFDPARFPAQGVFFQAPTGATADKPNFGNLPTLLNAYGYFVEFGSDAGDRPGFLPAGNPSYRYRLKQWQVPSENFKLYQHTAVPGGKNYLGPTSLNWIDLAAAAPLTIASNVIALFAIPRSGPADITDGYYYYNSRADDSTANYATQQHQLPPEVDLILVAIDEASALRTQGKSNLPPPELTIPAHLFRETAESEENLHEFLSQLSQNKIRHIALRSSVKIRAARWNKDI